MFIVKLELIHFPLASDPRCPVWGRAVTQGSRRDMVRSCWDSNKNKEGSIRRAGGGIVFTPWDKDKTFQQPKRWDSAFYGQDCGNTRERWETLTKRMLDNMEPWRGTTLLVLNCCWMNPQTEKSFLFFFLLRSKDGAESFQGPQSSQAGVCWRMTALFTAGLIKEELPSVRTYLNSGVQQLQRDVKVFTFWN